MNDLLADALGQSACVQPDGKLKAVKASLNQRMDKRYKCDSLSLLPLNREFGEASIKN